MLTKIEIENFGPLKSLSWDHLGKINLIVGGNGSGKTFLLKALYTAVRTLEEYRRGDDPRHMEDILAEKLYWTFQAEKIGDLVSKGQEAPLRCLIGIDTEELTFSFGKDTVRKITNIKCTSKPSTANSVFLPAKEVLSLLRIILKSRDQDKLFGFDDTYVDLARALHIPTQKGRNLPEFARSRRDLEKMIGGKVEYEETTERWEYKQGNTRFSIGVTAEGVKKIAILDTLLGNRTLRRDSKVFVDEPESALHPTAISEFLDIIALLAENGIQFFLASHSYFVVKKLFLIATEKKMSIPLIAADEGTWQTFDLRDGLPENAIINESIRLYREETELALR